MQLSVITNSKGEILAAAIPSDAAPTTGPHAVDQLKLLDGQEIHEVSIPPELAEAFLEGKFSKTFCHYKFVREGSAGALKRK